MAGRTYDLNEPEDFREVFRLLGWSGPPAAPKRRNKYNAEKVEADGHTFDSKKEHARYLQLSALQARGEIAGLKVHPEFDLEVNGHHICRYVGDYQYEEGGRLMVEDVKGCRTRVYRIKRALMWAVYGISIKET
jgi:hypothetical protein